MVIQYHGSTLLYAVQNGKGKTITETEEDRDRNIVMELNEDNVNWYINDFLFGKTPVPSRPFYLVYCTPRANASIEILRGGSSKSK